VAKEAAPASKDPEEESKKLRKKEKKEEKRRLKEEKASSEPLLHEIKKSNKKIDPPGKKRKAQREIIDRFIKVQPSISKPVFTNAPGVDLSEASTLFSDQIISETLVEILIKQGKREKAIEVLKKLIWKIPQKKSTFAAQIEELKRS
jgi:predicted Zn-dependent protease